MFSIPCFLSQNKKGVQEESVVISYATLKPMQKTFSYKAFGGEFGLGEWNSKLVVQFVNVGYNTRVRVISLVPYIFCKYCKCKIYRNEIPNDTTCIIVLLSCVWSVKNNNSAVTICKAFCCFFSIVHFSCLSLYNFL